VAIGFQDRKEAGFLRAGDAMASIKSKWQNLGKEVVDGVKDREPEKGWCFTDCGHHTLK